MKKIDLIIQISVYIFIKLYFLDKFMVNFDIFHKVMKCPSQ